MHEDLSHSTAAFMVNEIGIHYNRYSTVICSQNHYFVFVFLSKRQGNFGRGKFCRPCEGSTRDRSKIQGFSQYTRPLLHIKRLDWRRAPDGLLAIRTVKIDFALDKVASVKRDASCTKKMAAHKSKMMC